MAVEYTLPLTVAVPFEVQYALALAARRWGPQAALRMEDGNTGLTVFRGRYRVGHRKRAPVGGAMLFIEHGCGDSWALAFADADRQEKAPTRV